MPHYKIEYQVSIFRKKDKEVLTKLSGEFEFITNKDGSVDPGYNEKIKELIMRQVNTPASPYAALWEKGVISFEVTVIKVKELQSVTPQPEPEAEVKMTCLADVLWGILEIENDVVDTYMVRRIRKALDNQRDFKAVLFETVLHDRYTLIGFAIFEKKGENWMLHGSFDEHDTWTEEQHAHLYSSYWRKAAAEVGIDIEKVIPSDIYWNKKEVQFAIERKNEPIVLMQDTKCYAF